ncbi:hypothetical protein [Pediococcus ethanolidurans]|uniref:hypothetical protein n=1 Tax=Pediococcus ethanolidurans TaxID=319653 RepID=UPI001C1EA09A|nr:hypothetical protein [Pediococcus ethanolidurans]MBU7555683.1 hypothetical protein [Pediococcus ethanolidurans]MBU7564316.1 hypothetical protein [Pediococcus ethanolidurans]MCV3315245.1 hypothetical protein [Pediococcus ethanolidurans]MCV3321472.1 hypothetical protein [Pediococcus ethanolidurans]MCV3323446.1 hypothetical protein [Pediococcus ethanolidurans]
MTDKKQTGMPACLIEPTGKDKIEQDRLARIHDELVNRQLAELGITPRQLSTEKN